MQNVQKTSEMHPVVRCQDCKYGKPTTNGVGQAVIKCWNICVLCGVPRLLELDWYCADGERRDEGGINYEVD